MLTKRTANSIPTQNTGGCPSLRYAVSQKSIRDRRKRASAPGTQRAHTVRSGHVRRGSRGMTSRSAQASTTCRPRRCAVAMRRRAVPSSRPGDAAATPSSRAAAPSKPAFTCLRVFSVSTCSSFGNGHHIPRCTKAIAGRRAISRQILTVLARGWDKTRPDHADTAVS